MRIPLPDMLIKKSKALAVLDAVLSAEWEYRFFSFNSHWSENQMMASMRDGQGDEYYILFSSAGVVIKGYKHDSDFINDHDFSAHAASQLPESLKEFLTEPAFSIQEMTFLHWIETGKKQWSQAISNNIHLKKANDGSDDLLSWLSRDYKYYSLWANKYYGVKLQQKIVRQIFMGDVLTWDMTLKLNSNASLDQLTADAMEIGYPFIIE